MDLPLLCGTVALLATSLPGAPCPRAATACAGLAPAIVQQTIVAADGAFAMQVRDSLAPAKVPSARKIGSTVRIDADIRIDPKYEGAVR